MHVRVYLCMIVCMYVCMYVCEYFSAIYSLIVVVDRCVSIYVCMECYVIELGCVDRPLFKLCKKKEVPGDILYKLEQMVSHCEKVRLLYEYIYVCKGEVTVNGLSDSCSLYGLSCLG